MRINSFTISRVVLIVCMLLSGRIFAFSQDIAQHEFTPMEIIGNELAMVDDSLKTVNANKANTIRLKNTKDTLHTIVADTTKQTQKHPARDWATWRPDPQRALWLALVIPGAGQIYNRKFWKLPIIYGGIMGCVYAMRWNNMMFKDYSQAYLDLMDDDPHTASYEQFLHLGRYINDSNKSQYQEIFRKRKDYYRKYRDMSFFIMVGVYALSVIDAYVDAELSVFDMSRDLSMKVKPAVIGSDMCNNPLRSSGLGFQCSLNF